MGAFTGALTTGVGTGALTGTLTTGVGAGALMTGVGTGALTTTGCACVTTKNKQGSINERLQLLMAGFISNGCFKERERMLRCTKPYFVC
jgi:hypothetical protein